MECRYETALAHWNSHEMPWARLYCVLGELCSTETQRTSYTPSHWLTYDAPLKSWLLKQINETHHSYNASLNWLTKHTTNFMLLEIDRQNNNKIKHTHLMNKSIIQIIAIETDNNKIYKQHLQSDRGREQHWKLPFKTHRDKQQKITLLYRVSLFLCCFFSSCNEHIMRT